MFDRFSRPMLKKLAARGTHPTPSTLRHKQDLTSPAVTKTHTLHQQHSLHGFLDIVIAEHDLGKNSTPSAEAEEAAPSDVDQRDDRGEREEIVLDDDDAKEAM